MRNSVLFLHISALLLFYSNYGVRAQSSSSKITSTTATTKSVATQSTTTTSSTTGNPSAAVWRYPLVENFTVDWVDTVMLQWDSNFANEAYLLMWCQLDGPGPAVKIAGPQLRVLPSGVFPYIFFSQNQDQKIFPVACHAQLAVTVYGQAFDDPVGITFTSQTNRKAQTFSMAVSSTTTSASSTTPLSTQQPTGPTTREAGPTPATFTTLPKETSTPVERPHKLTTGEKAGIGVIVVVFCLLFLTAFVGVFTHSKRKQRRRDAEQAVAMKPREEKDDQPQWGRFELEDEGRRRHELGSTQAGQELDGKCTIHEMGAVVYEIEGCGVPEADVESKVIMPRVENKARKSEVGSAKTRRSSEVGTSDMSLGGVRNSSPRITEMASGTRNSEPRKTGIRRKGAAVEEGRPDSIPVRSARLAGDFI